MINGLSNKDFVLSVLKDGQPHYSREFVTGKFGEPLLLDYRKRISELRQEGYQIVSLKYRDSLLTPLRPAYRLLKPEAA